MSNSKKKIMDTLKILKKYYKKQQYVKAIKLLEEDIGIIEVVSSDDEGKTQPKKILKKLLRIQLTVMWIQMMVLN